MVKYIRNEHGSIHSVEDDHYDEYLTTTTPSGNVFLKPGFTEVTEDDARSENPQLFGEHDPAIVYTAGEMAERRQREQLIAEFGDPTVAEVKSEDPNLVTPKASK